MHGEIVLTNQELANIMVKEINEDKVDVSSASIQSEVDGSIIFGINITDEEVIKAVKSLLESTFQNIGDVNFIVKENDNNIFTF